MDKRSPLDASHSAGGSGSPPPSVCNCLHIRKAARHVSQFYDRSLASTGLRVTQFSVLNRLNVLGPRTIGELAAELAMDRTTMGRNLGPLERDGLVKIAADPRDRRRRALSLTGEGRARMEAARAKWVEAQASFETAFGAERSRELRATLASVLDCEFDGDARRADRLGDDDHAV